MPPGKSQLPHDVSRSRLLQICNSDAQQPWLQVVLCKPCVALDSPSITPTVSDEHDAEGFVFSVANGDDSMRVNWWFRRRGRDDSFGGWVKKALGGSHCQYNWSRIIQTRIYAAH